jgi:hypothetical protein
MIALATGAVLLIILQHLERLNFLGFQLSANGQKRRALAETGRDDVY